MFVGAMHSGAAGMHAVLPGPHGAVHGGESMDVVSHVSEGGS